MAPFLVSTLTPRAQARYDQALWYTWGRQDAGDDATRGTRAGYYLGDDFAFAQYAATEAEDYEQGRSCSLRCIGDQYRAFLATL